MTARLRLLLAIVLLASFIPIYQGYGGELLCNNPPERVYLLRHAEREDNSHDSPLSIEGEQRAISLVEAIGDSPIKAIYTTPLRRTIETATPLATQKEVKIQQIYKSDIDELISKICSDNAGGVIVVVGHSGTIPKILSRFQLESDYPDYGELFVIDFQDKNITVTKGWFGKQ